MFVVIIKTHIIFLIAEVVTKKKVFRIYAGQVDSKVQFSETDVAQASSRITKELAAGLVLRSGGPRSNAFVSPIHRS